MPAISNELIIFICIVAAIPILLGIRRRREAIRYRFKKTIIVEVIFLGVTLIVIKMGGTALNSILVGTVAALVVGASYNPRSRYIPTSVRRKARAEFELKTGKKFNPRKHEYDHDVPFSRGGSHTGDNVHVVDKKKNRSKGSKSAWWDVLGK